MTKQKVWQKIAALAVLVATPTASLASDVESAGNTLAYLLPLAGIATATIKHDRQGQIQFLKSLATNAVLTGGLKASIDKRRPDGDCCDSFPSGHTSFAFMGASFLHKRYGRKYAIPVYAAASFVAYSRVVSDRHYVEDVVAGAAIGYLSSYFFTTKYKGVTVSPVASDNFVGITFNKVW
jgi:membrane-associated phospholipid phosphatase